MSLKNEGSVEIWLSHPQPDWQTNTQRYKFQDKRTAGLVFEAIKDQYKILEINFEGPFGRKHQFAEFMPKSDHNDLHVVITWKSNKIRLHLNGEIRETPDHVAKVDARHHAS